MPNIKEVVHRINSITATQQITNAMKMVAAARLGKVQQQVLQIRPYAEKLTMLLQNVMASSEPQLTPGYLEKRPVKNLLLVVMSSDRGLCGAFNAKVLKKTLQYIRTAAHDLGADQITILPIGRKAFSFFEKRKWQLIPDHRDIGLSQRRAFNHVSLVVDFLMDTFLQQAYDQVVLVYNAFQNAATHVPTVEELLPITIHNAESSNQTMQTDYIYEPSRVALLASLIPYVLHVKFYKAWLASSASEHGARMTTMSQATDNAKELLRELKLTYNRTRQAAITQEISEIVAGAKALTA